MDETTYTIIQTQIAPLVQNGDLTLFLGAGVSIGTPSINGLGIPSTPKLIQRICEEAGYEKEDAEKADLPTAFGVGEDEIDNFDNFLISNFSTIKPEAWQKSIFKNWWRAIFTTNIDNIPKVCIEELKKEPRDYPDYQIFNYLDREPVESIPTSPPVVYLHGNISTSRIDH